MSPGSKNSSNGSEQRRLAARKPNLWLRARIIQAMRRFFIQRHYLEIETPYLVPAPAPEAHIDAFNAGNGFLHTSPELCMKRLLAAGYPKIFQICKCFRQSERGDRHLPEFTILEWYRTGIDYGDLMDECEEMIIGLSHGFGRGKVIGYQGLKIHLESPWDRISVRAAFQRFTSISMAKALEYGRFDEVMVNEIEPHLGNSKPAFLFDYPASLGALSRLKENDPTLAERFELYIGGLELANGFSELTDAAEQETRFEKEQQTRRELGKTVYPMPEKFLQALRYMPRAAGIALGVDRLAMVFADTTSVNDVVTFTPEEL